MEGRRNRPEGRCYHLEGPRYRQEGHPDRLLVELPVPTRSLAAAFVTSGYRLESPDGVHGCVGSSQQARGSRYRRAPPAHCSVNAGGSGEGEGDPTRNAGKFVKLEVIMSVDPESRSQDLIQRIWIPELFGSYIDPTFTVCRQIHWDHRSTFAKRRQIHSVPRSILHIVSGSIGIRSPTKETRLSYMLFFKRVTSFFIEI